MASQARILIVEDEAIVALDLELQLKRLGYRVLGSAASAEEAIRMTAEHLPDLVLMDIRLQGELDGIAAAEIVRREHARPVIFLTAHADDATLQRARLSEPFGYLLKPFEERELLTAIEMGLYKHSAETRLRRDERRFATTLSSIGDAVIATDALGKITFMNPIAEQATGWQEDDAKGLALDKVFAIVEETGRKPLETPVQRVLRHMQPVELANNALLRGKEGREIAIEDSAAPILDDHGNCQGVVLVFRDVTQRRRLQQEMQESEARKAAIFQSAPDGILILDAQGILRECNPAAERLFGVKCENLLGRSLDGLLTPIDGAAFPWHDAKPPTTGVRQEFRGRQPGGASFQVEIALGQYSWGGEPMTVAFLRDVTSARVVEDQLRQAQKMEGIGQLAGGIAHDFNNLLTIINGYSMVLQTSIPESHPWHAQVTQIVEAGNRAANLTRQLLSFSRKSMVQPSALHLNVIIAGMQNILGRLLGEKVRIITDLDPDLGTIRADAGQIEQILLNLAVNARDAMPHGGDLILATESRFCSNVLGLAPGRYQVLCVRDTGVGMDEAVKAHLFEPFFTTKEIGKGTGMGLATVYGIVQQSRGHIAVESTPGAGTTFRLYFPTAEGAMAEAIPPPLALDWTSKGETVLLVEDDPDVRHFIFRVLGMAGYRVLEAESGQEALQQVEQAGGAVDLLVSDMIMPGMNGQELSAQLRQRWPSLKVLFLTGYADVNLISEADDAHRALLLKPFEPEALLRKLREMLAAK